MAVELILSSINTSLTKMVHFDGAWISPSMCNLCKPRRLIDAQPNPTQARHVRFGSHLFIGDGSRMKGGE